MQLRYFLFFAGLVLASAARAQQSGAPFPSSPAPLNQQTGQPGQSPLDPHKQGNDDPFAAQQAARAAKLLETDRRKHIEVDTAKLIQLSNELKVDVDKSTKDEMSLDVIRKAAEIEKLAHEVKERMKGN